MITFLPLNRSTTSRIVASYWRMANERRFLHELWGAATFRLLWWSQLVSTTTLVVIEPNVKINSTSYKHRVLREEMEPYVVQYLGPDGFRLQQNWDRWISPFGRSCFPAFGVKICSCLRVLRHIWIHILHSGAKSLEQTIHNCERSQRGADAHLDDDNSRTVCKHYR